MSVKDCVEAYFQEHGFVSFGFPAIVIDKDGRKEARHPQGWAKITKDNFKNYVKESDRSCAILTGHKSGITVIDFDVAEEYPKFIEKFPQFKDAYTVKTRRGYHIYCKYNKKVNQTDNVFKDFDKVDVRNDGGLIYAPPTKYKVKNEVVKYERVENLKKLLDFPVECLKEKGFKSNFRTKTEDTINVPSGIEEDSTSEPGFGVLDDSMPFDIEREVNKITEIIDTGLLDHKKDWSDWMDVLFALKGLGDYQLALRFSKRCSEKHDDDYTKKQWDSIKNDKENNITFRSIYYWARKGNPSRYAEAFPEDVLTLKILSLPVKLADYITEKVKQDLKFSNRVWYLYDPEVKLWRALEKEPTDFIIRAIHDEIDEAIEVCLSNAQDPQRSTELSESLESFKIKVDTKNYASMIITHLERPLQDDNFYRKLDLLEYKIPFKNGIIDLKTKTFSRGRKREHYLTHTIPYDYEPSTEKSKTEISNMIFKIANANQEHQDYLSSVLAYCMIRKPELEKAIWFFIGYKGDNGKTTLLYLLTEIMQKYWLKMDNKAIAEKTANKHKHLNKLKGGPMGAYIEENKNGERLDESIIKQLAEGKKIDNEVMYGTTEDIYITCKVIVISNNTPVFKADGGMDNRLRICKFNSVFKTTIEKDDYKKLLFKADPKLCDRIITTPDLRNAFIDYLVDYAYAYCVDGKLKPCPEEWKLETEETLCMNNKLKMIYDDYLEVGNGYRLNLSELRFELKELNSTEAEMRDYLKKEGFVYKKDVRHEGKRGAFEGIRKKIIIKVEEKSVLGKEEDKKIATTKEEEEFDSDSDSD